MTIKEILEYLDGRGLIITDDELIEEAIKELGLNESTEVK